MTEEIDFDVAIVGGGVAGLSAATFTARHGLETVVLSAGGSLLRRNAHIENYPGFPAGINSRHLLELMREQAEQSGSSFREAEVTRVTDADDGFDVETGAGDRLRAAYVVAATKNATGFLEDLDGVEIIEQGKAYVATDERGRTSHEGVYAAGRLARKPHQAIVAAGHGAEVAVTLLEDDERPFYHDWIAPEGYFTGRGREVPPGCEEIDEEERTERERASLDVVQERFAEAHPERPEQHPSVRED